MRVVILQYYEANAVEARICILQKSATADGDLHCKIRQMIFYKIET